MPQGDPLSVDYGGLTDRHISLDDTLCVKATKRPGRPKKCDVERVRTGLVHCESAALPLVLCIACISRQTDESQSSASQIPS